MEFFKALKRICDDADTGDVIVFVIFLTLLPPFALIWLAYRILQEMDVE